MDPNAAISGYFVLDERHNVVPAPDLVTWATWRYSDPENRIVQQDYVGQDFVSTVFLGIDMSIFRHDRPREIFETAIIGPPPDGVRITGRCGTYGAAIEQHARAVKSLAPGNESVE